MTVRSRLEEESQRPDRQNIDKDVDSLDTRARKRVQVGLSPRRPTAKAALSRPPDTQRLPLPPAFLALLLVLVLVSTILLMTANMMGVLPAWLPSWGSNRATEAPSPVTASRMGSFSLRLADDFSNATTPLRQSSQPDEWQTELIPSESIYRLSVAPDHLAWSLLGLSDLAGYRLQTSALVDGVNPAGFAGLLVRYQDEGQFYLFAVDGNGRYMIQQQDGEQSTIIQPWTAAPVLTAAGSANLLTVEDDGRVVRFYGNNTLLGEIVEPEFAVGYIGLAGGLQGGNDVAIIDFDWFQLYDGAVISE